MSDRAPHGLTNAELRDWADRVITDPHATLAHTSPHHARAIASSVTRVLDEKPAYTTPRREYTYYLVLYVAKGEIRGIGLYTEETPTAMGEDTFVVGEASSYESLDAACKFAEQMLAQERYAWAGQLETAWGRTYRVARKAAS